MKWTEAYEHSGRTVTIPIKLIRAIGPKGAIFISQLFYWKGKQQDPNGWIYKTKHELEEETGLARWEQDTCTAELKKKGILETRYDRLDHRLYYRIQKDVLDSIMEATSPSEIGNHAFGKSEKTLSPKSEPRSRETRKTAFVIKQENTTESTTENTTTKTSAPSQATNGNRAAHAVVVSSSLACEDDEPRDISDKLTEEFGLSIPQGQKVDNWLASEGIDYVLEKARIVRSKPRSNLAGAFMSALRDDWQAPRSNEPEKPRQKKKNPNQSELPLSNEDIDKQREKDLPRIKKLKGDVIDSLSSRL